LNPVTVSQSSGAEVTLTPVTITSVTTTSEVPSSTSSPSRTALPRVTVTTTIPLPYDLPPGFGWINSDAGLAVRQLANEEFECRDAQNKCFGIEVYSGPGCPNGANVTMTVHAAVGDAQLGRTSDVTMPIPPGGRARAIMGYDPHGVAVTADLSSVSC
jgi:hypothetical protein